MMSTPPGSATSGSRWLLIAFAIIWTFVGFYMVLFVAGIKSIPQEMLEAARVWTAPGGSAPPWSRSSRRWCGTTSRPHWCIWASSRLDAFTFVSVMTPNGGTDNSTKVVSLHLYQTAFNDGHFGEASGWA